MKTFLLSILSFRFSTKPFSSKDFNSLDKLLGSIFILGAILVTGVPYFSLTVSNTKAMDNVPPSFEA